MRRLLDIIVSLTALLLFLPFGLAIAVVLRFSGEGEIFYLQSRVGRGGRLFGLIKFATMLKASPSMGTGTVTIRNDPRILGMGKLLRKTKLNEVPQLINVLRGDMSLVGPRPLTPQTFKYYGREVQRQIFSVKPGLTGLGSVVFRDEESVLARSQKATFDCYGQDIAPYKGQLEVWYIRNRTLVLDLKLLFLTVVVVFCPRSKGYQRFFPGLPKSQA